MLARRLLVPCLLASTFFTLHCSDDEKPSRGDDDDAGEGGDTGGGAAGTGGGKAGSGNAGRAGSASGASGSGTGGSSAGSSSGSCDPGEIRSCTGPEACRGMQECAGDGTWFACDCGDDATGGTGGTSSSEGGDGGTGQAQGGDGGSEDGGSSGSGATAGSGATSGSSGSGGSAGSAGSAGAGGSAGSSGASGSSGAGGSSGSTSAGGASGSSGASGASGNAGSSGTAGAGGSAGSCGAGEGLELVPEPALDPGVGWIDRSTNCVGVQGAIYTRADIGGSGMEIIESDGRICVSGHAEEALGDDFDTYWGAALVIQLNNTNDVVTSYNASTYGVDGFKFTLTDPGTGAGIPDEIRPRLLVGSAGTEYCKQVCATGNQSILFSEAHPECWSGLSTSTPSLTTLRYLEFHVPSQRDGQVDFEFCIDDLTAIVNNTPVGDPGECSSGGSGTGSCVGHCDEPDPVAGGCYCDDLCDLAGDCCEDYADECSAGG